MRFTASSAFGNSSKKPLVSFKERIVHDKVVPFDDDLLLSWRPLSLLLHFPRPTRPLDVEQLAKPTVLIVDKLTLCAIHSTSYSSLKLTLSRTWTWEPKTGNVTYETKDKDGKPVKVSYNRSQLNTAPAKCEGRH